MIMNKKFNDLANKKIVTDKNFIKWCFDGLTEDSLKTTSDAKLLAVAKQIEKDWGNEILGKTDEKQWTTKLCETSVMEALIALGRKNVTPTTSKKSSLRDKKYSPDLQCDEFVYEVKGRSWCTPGTAGEKILGVPVKYGEVPRLYGKPLKIILVGYQEYEARNGFGFGDLLDSDNQTEELKKTLAFYKSMNIEYVGFTEILKELGLKPE